MKRSISLGLVLCCVATMAAYGQTNVDLRNQTRNVDFSSAAITRPVKTGTALPAACGVGEMYFLTTAASGQNLYGCPAANTWAQMSGAVSSGLPDATGQSGKVLAVSGTNPAWLAPAGDADGAVNTLTVRKLQNRTVAATAPFNGQSLAWNATANSGLGQWEPTTVSGGGGGGSSTVSAGTGVTVSQVGTNFAVGIDTAVVPAALFSSAPLDFPSLTTGNCAAPLTMTMAGAVAGSALSPGWPAGLEAGLLPFMRVSAAGTISVWVCNLSGATVNPATATYTAVLVRGF